MIFTKLVKRAGKRLKMNPFWSAKKECGWISKEYERKHKRIGRVCQNALMQVTSLITLLGRPSPGWYTQWLLTQFNTTLMSVWDGGAGPPSSPLNYKKFMHWNFKQQIFSAFHKNVKFRLFKWILPFPADDFQYQINP